MKEEKNRKKIFLVIGFLFILLTVFFLLVTRNKESKEEIKSDQKVIPSQEAKKVDVIEPTPKYHGQLVVRTKDGKKDYSQEEIISLVVYADSDGKSITGYDVVIPYDRERVRYVGTNNLFKNFQVFSQTKDGLLTITGVKKLNVTTSTILVDQPLVEIIFKPVSQGRVDFDLSYSPNEKRDSNLIDENSEEVLGKVKGVRVTIQ